MPARSRGLAVSAVAVSLVGCAPELMDPPVYAVAVPPPAQIEVVTVQPQTASRPVVLDEALVGEWEGVGLQGENVRWSFVLHLTSTRGRCAEVEYPSIPCSAYWTCEGVLDGDLLAVEHLTGGQDQCVDGGRVRMHLRADGRLDWRFEDEPGRTSATAVLARR